MFQAIISSGFDLGAVRRAVSPGVPQVVPAFGGELQFHGQLGQPGLLLGRGAERTMPPGTIQVIRVVRLIVVHMLILAGEMISPPATLLGNELRPLLGGTDFHRHSRVELHAVRFHPVAEHDSA